MMSNSITLDEFMDDEIRFLLLNNFYIEIIPGKPVECNPLKMLSKIGIQSENKGIAKDNGFRQFRIVHFGDE